MTGTRRRAWLAAGLCAIVGALCTAVQAFGDAPAPDDAGVGQVRIGSKKFTESVVLGELGVGLARALGAKAEHHRELGGTRILWEALRRGDIDVYPEYTGTIAEELLGNREGRTPESMARALRDKGVVMGAPLGFDNTYAIAMKERRAAALGITRISDLSAHPDLRFGWTSEFMDRADGWPGLSAHYGLARAHVRGLDHDLAYRAIDADSIDVTDAYATDAEIAHHDLRVLLDDRRYFPSYEALWLYRADWVQAQPALHRQLERLAGQLDAPDMRALNGQVKLAGQSESAVAAGFLRAQFGIAALHEEPTALSALTDRTLEHLFLVGTSMAAAILLALPLGIAAARRPRLGQLVLSLVGLLQTIPSLALLVFMIPLLGIGAPPAIAALFVYSLLPIVRNTHAGLAHIDRRLRESADALGLSPGARLRLVELPLSLPSILAGIKTSAVINVGTATLGALIGAGGYGQPILTGIRLDDQALILQGAVPAAAMAIAVQWTFDGVERWLVPRGLRA